MTIGGKPQAEPLIRFHSDADIVEIDIALPAVKAEEGEKCNGGFLWIDQYEVLL